MITIMKFDNELRKFRSRIDQNLHVISKPNDVRCNFGAYIPSKKSCWGE